MSFATTQEIIRTAPARATTLPPLKAERAIGLKQSVSRSLHHAMRAARLCARSSARNAAYSYVQCAPRGWPRLRAEGAHRERRRCGANHSEDSPLLCVKGRLARAVPLLTTFPVLHGRAG